MTNTLKIEANRVARILLDAGYDTYFVGGSVRDGFLNHPIKDIDIATAALPQDVQRLFPGSDLVGASFGVVIVKSGDYSFEVTTFRKDGRYIDCRHPEFVTFGTIHDDAARRDFTINCLYQHPRTGEILDFYGGILDAQRKIIRCVGNAEDRFEEDALRMLRAVRFASRFGFDIELRTFEALVRHSTSILDISTERIREELNHMITGPNPGLALDLLVDTDLLDLVLPEVSALTEIDQEPEHHPEGNAFEHTKLTLEMLEPRVSTHAWACLLHDIGKAATTAIGEDGKIHAYEHHKFGADLANDALERLRFPNKEKDLIVRAVYDHMKLHHATEMSRSKVRRLLGSAHFDIVLALHKADCLASNGDLGNFRYLTGVQEEFKNEPVIPPPLITGKDLLELGIPPGPIYGRILREIQTMQLEGTVLCSKRAKCKVVTLLARYHKEEADKPRIS